MCRFFYNERRPNQKPNEMDDKYLSGDPKLLWQDQIAGVIEYDHSDFLGAMVDLQGDPDWTEAFTAIKDDPGVPEFLERLQNHFDLCRPQIENGVGHVYQHPTRTKKQGGQKDQEAMVALAKRYLDTVAAAQADAGDEEYAEQFRAIKVAWMDDPASVNEDPYARDGAPAEISKYEAMEEVDDDEITDSPKIMSELREACYGMAASYELQRYLMQSFHTHSYDVDAIYELNWVHGCEVYFDETTCYVYDVNAHKAWKDEQKSAK